MEHKTLASPASYGEGPAPCVTVRASRQLLRGLSGLHRVGVVNRDLKPENVLVRRPQRGDASYVKLADVGLATRVDADRSSYTAISNVGRGVETKG